MMPFCGFQNIDEGGGGRGDFQMGNHPVRRGAFAKAIAAIAQENAITLFFLC
jgi:hypothetical protein